MEMINKEVLEKFKNEIKQKKESGSYLFFSDKRVDLLESALVFVKMICCKEEELDYCDNCRICKSINNRSFVDMNVINEDLKGIKIDDVRQIIEKSYETSYEGNKKIVIINGFESIKKEPSNALLKILEEPPKDVFFLILSHSLNILPTIKSRTKMFYIKPLTKEELDVSKEIYDFFDGNMNQIEKWRQNQNNLSYDNSLDINIENIKHFFDKEEIVFEDEIDYIKSLKYISDKYIGLKDIDKLNLVESIINIYTSRKDEIDFLLQKIILFSKDKIVNIDKLTKIKNSLKSNVNAKIVIYSFFICLEKSYK